MPRIRQKTLATALRVGCTVLLAVAAIALFRFIPGGAEFFHSIARYLLLLGSSVALLFLGLAAIYSMYKNKDHTNLGRSIFGFLCGVLLALFMEGLIRDPDVIDSLFSGLTPLGIYARSFAAGVVLSELGTLTRRTGHPFLVFLCSSIASIMIELLTMPDVEIDLNWLVAFLFGIGIHQMFRFRSVSRLHLDAEKETPNE